MAQEQGFELLPRAAPILDRIGPCAAEVADRFIRRLGNVDRGQFPRS